MAETTARWRKKPVEIEAMQVSARNGAEVAAWCGGESFDVAMAPGQTHHVRVPTPEVVDAAAKAAFGPWALDPERTALAVIRDHRDFTYRALKRAGEAIGAMPPAPDGGQTADTRAAVLDEARVAVNAAVYQLLADERLESRAVAAAQLAADEALVELGAPSSPTAPLPEERAPAPGETPAAPEQGAGA